MSSEKIRKRPVVNKEIKHKDEFIKIFDDKKIKTLSLIIPSILTLLSFITRFYKIYHPNSVVFDEVHFGKFASYYLRRTYYFDVHPPLGKLMIAGMAYLLNYDGHFLFDHIGDDYLENNVPYIGLRALTATFGAFYVPLVYFIMMESGYNIFTAILAAVLILFDNLLICQTRLILLDSMLSFFMLCTFYSYIKFYKYRYREFCNEWWFWLITTGISLGSMSSVKMVGLFTFITIGIMVIIDLWRLWDIKTGLSLKRFNKHFLGRIFGLIIVPICVYLFWFYIHFAILNTTGPGDKYMSPEFQQTLHGNILLKESQPIYYNDTIVLKHKDTKVFLHSHIHHYPRKYDDGRVSSAGQQVTAYRYQDKNNHWRILQPPLSLLHHFSLSSFNNKNSSSPLSSNNSLIKNKDFIMLEHVNTDTLLLTHDVASPLLRTNQEFTTIDIATTDNYDRLDETIFQVFIENGDENTFWKTKASYIKLVHWRTKVALWTHDSRLPEWAFNQQEVNGNRIITDDSNIWVADQLIGKNVTGLSETKEPIDNVPFLKKFIELQSLMIKRNSRNTKPHSYQSSPSSWLFLSKGILFWKNIEEKQQIYLLGNPISWALSMFGID
ncbi:15447_t:CDS:2 [Entrophospora sp. SA101]|nr:15447_t:CDS:2 [Entrophospora sp. SA101]